MAVSELEERTLRVCALYPDLMNIYADRGNLFVLQRRCEWRGIGFRLKGSGLGEALDGGAHDIYYIGGGQDRDQLLCAEDLVAGKRAALHEAASRDAVVLGVCGGYQLLGESYTLGDEQLEGVGLLDVRTVREPGERLIGNVAIEVDLGGSPTGLGSATASPAPADKCWRASRTTAAAPTSDRRPPLGRVLKGHGNDGHSGHRGRKGGQHDRHLPAWSTAAKEHVVCGLAYRTRARRRSRRHSRRSMTAQRAAHASARRAAGV